MVPRFSCLPESSPRFSAPARPCGRGRLAQFRLPQRFAVWWVALPWPILSVPAVLLALCRVVVLFLVPLVLVAVLAREELPDAPATLPAGRPAAPRGPFLRHPSRGPGLDRGDHRALPDRGPVRRHAAGSPAQRPPGASVLYRVPGYLLVPLRPPQKVSKLFGSFAALRQVRSTWNPAAVMSLSGKRGQVHFAAHSGRAAAPTGTVTVFGGLEPPRPAPASAT